MKVNLFIMMVCSRVGSCTEPEALRLVRSARSIDRSGHVIWVIPGDRTDGPNIILHEHRPTS